MVDADVEEIAARESIQAVKLLTKPTARRSELTIGFTSRKQSTA